MGFHFHKCLVARTDGLKKSGFVMRIQTSQPWCELFELRESTAHRNEGYCDISRHTSLQQSSPGVLESLSGTLTVTAEPTHTHCVAISGLVEVIWKERTVPLSTAECSRRCSHLWCGQGDPERRNCSVIGRPQQTEFSAVVGTKISTERALFPASRPEVSGNSWTVSHGQRKERRGEEENGQRRERIRCYNASNIV